VDLLDALDLAVAELRRRLVVVADDAWSNPTPCDDWDVRYLVAHVVGGHRFAALALDGWAVEAAIHEVMSENVLGARPVEDHDAAAVLQRLGFRRPGALTSVVDHPAGSITGSEFLAMRVFDVAVHTWDLARATDGDERLDPDLAQSVLDILTGMPAGAGFGIVPIGAATASDSPQVQVLDLSGRR
jgi:uncharacterized protein (TIGR03086 family)